MPTPRNFPSPLIKTDVPPDEKDNVIFLMKLDGYTVGVRQQDDGNFTIIGHLR